MEISKNHKSVECRICGSYETGDYFSNKILICRRCGIIFLSPELVMEKPHDYYSSRYAIAAYTDEDRLANLSQNALEVLAIMRRYIETRGKLIDIGANTGIFVKEAGSASFQAMGLEPSETLVKKALEAGIELKQGSIETFNPDQPFRVITMFHVLEHTTDPVRIIKKISTMLEPRGVFVVEVPNSESYLAIKDQINWRYIALEHLFYFTKATLSKLLTTNGFEIIHVEKRNFDMHELNIKKLFRYFGIGKQKIERLNPKDEVKNTPNSIQNKNPLKKLLKEFLIYVINLLGRGDHILIIARKI